MECWEERWQRYEAKSEMNQAIVAICGMALVTYATRAGGIWLMARVRPTPRVAAWLRALPGTTLTAIVVPNMVQSGFVGLIAVGGTIVVARRVQNPLVAMIAGVILFQGTRVLVAAAT